MDDVGVDFYLAFLDGFLDGIADGCVDRCDCMVETEVVAWCWGWFVFIVW